MKIAIVGAGPAGLTCARILSQAGIDVQIFERDESPQARQQGGSLDLHENAGQAALKRAGLFSEFEKYARYDGEDMVLCDRFGKCHAEVRDTDRGRPEIDRTQLRQILLDSLPKDMIRWNSNLRSAEAGKLHFAHGTESGFDLIIGADGTWSKIRPLLTPIPPFYSGISGFEIRLGDADAKHPQLSKMIGNGNFFVFGDEDGHCLLSQRQSDRSIRTYAFGVKPESWINNHGINLDDPAAVRAAILRDYSDWAPEFRNLIENCDDDHLIPRSLYMLPVGLRWTTQPGLAIIGDAAHTMTPFAGQGVNVAMADAMTLAESIIAGKEDLTTAVNKYETAMYAYSRPLTQKTWDSLMDRFTVGGTQKMAVRIQAGVAAQAQNNAAKKVAA